MSEFATRPSPVRVASTIVRPRVLALAGGAVLSLSYLSVLYRVVDVAGRSVTTDVFVAAIVGSLLVAVVCARLVGSTWASLVGSTLLVGGLVAYLVAAPAGSYDGLKLVGDTAALLSGLSVLRVMEAGFWALGLAPGPVFLSWYFFARRSYAPGVLVGGAVLALLVLTGDLAVVPALVGVLGGVVAVGFGQLDREGAHPVLRDAVIVVLVAMLVVTTSASLVPGGEAYPLFRGGGATVESSLTSAEAQVDVLGSISLSPVVRFTVEATDDEYWRVGAYDRYTGGGWVRTGGSEPYGGPLDGSPARRVQRVEQTFVAESTVSTMPAAWKPVRLESGDRQASVTELGGLQPTTALQPGDRYRVTSVTPATPPPVLLGAGTDYPPEIEARYLALPESTPDRLGAFTSELTAGSDSPYRTAALIQDWLQTNKGYSLDVERPEGDVATAFVFEMDAGYCTYFATAMVAMLRTQGIPARFVVGYLPGDRVDADRWVVRGYDSHAWVEVYFPETGWVRFDPTPPGPRQAAERDRLSQARASSESNVDTVESAAAAGSPGPPVPPGAFGAFGPGTGANATNTSTPANGTGAGGNADPSLFGLEGPRGVVSRDAGPSSETLLYGVVLLLGAATVAVRLGLVTRFYRLLWLRRLPGGPPVVRVEAAVERGEYLLGRRHRPRRVGETRRAYLRALDERDGEGRGIDARAEALFHIGERARYGGRATQEDAADAVRLLEAVRTEFGRIG